LLAELLLVVRLLRGPHLAASRAALNTAGTATAAQLIFLQLLLLLAELLLPLLLLELLLHLQRRKLLLVWLLVLLFPAGIAAVLRDYCCCHCH
jgi:hypothetical protein